MFRTILLTYSESILSVNKPKRTKEGCAQRGQKTLILSIFLGIDEWTTFCLGKERYSIGCTNGELSYKNTTGRQPGLRIRIPVFSGSRSVIFPASDLPAAYRSCTYSIIYWAYNYRFSPEFQCICNFVLIFCRKNFVVKKDLRFSFLEKNLGQNLVPMLSILKAGGCTLQINRKQITVLHINWKFSKACFTLSKNCLKHNFVQTRFFKVKIDNLFAFKSYFTFINLKFILLFNMSGWSVARWSVDMSLKQNADPNPDKDSWYRHFLIH